MDRPAVVIPIIIIVNACIWGFAMIMSSHTLSRCGTVRRPRMMPPMPRVSAMVWRKPYFLGISKSTTVPGL